MAHADGRDHVLRRPAAAGQGLRPFHRGRERVCRGDHFDRTAARGDDHPMSSNYEFFAQCWSNEAPTFVRVLKALPDGQLDYRPHEKSASAGGLAWQLALEAAHLCELLDTGAINFDI